MSMELCVGWTAHSKFRHFQVCFNFYFLMDSPELPECRHKHPGWPDKYKESLSNTFMMLSFPVSLHTFLAGLPLTLIRLHPSLTGLWIFPVCFLLSLLLILIMTLGMDFCSLLPIPSGSEASGFTMKKWHFSPTELEGREQPQTRRLETSTILTESAWDVHEYAS